MNMSVAHIAGILKVQRPISSDDLARYRATWANAFIGQSVACHTLTLDRDVSLESILCASQDKFRAPHERWQWSRRPPIPFCWGPNGSLMLLGAMLAAYAAAVAIVLAIVEVVS